MDPSGPSSPKSPSSHREMPFPSLPDLNLPPPPEPAFENDENPAPQEAAFENNDENEGVYRNNPSPASAESQPLSHNSGLDADDDGHSSLSDSGDLYGMVLGITGRGKVENALMALPRFLGDMDFYAVFDGRGGDGVANLCKERMHVILADLVTDPAWDGDWIRALKICFAVVDKEAFSNLHLYVAGSTAVVAIVVRDRIIIANCGDSRAVLSRDGVVIPLTVDHKPDRPDEKARIAEASVGRTFNYGFDVHIILKISRAIGVRYLKPIVISEPEIGVVSRTKGDEFLILATKGLWNSVSNEEACDAARHCFTPRLPSLPSAGCANEAAELLVDLAFTKGCRDNISVVVVNLGNTASDDHN